MGINPGKDRMNQITLETPGGRLIIRRLVLDFTGTLSKDGRLLPGVADRLEALSSHLDVLILTADTFGTARGALEDLPVRVQLIEDGREKAEVVAALANEGVIAVGNGRNDIPMMEVAGLGVAVLGPEGAAAELLAAADIVVRDIIDALELPMNPLRVKATLRD
jgi:P-type E1-E2 ATPase